jgi:hypothetical protein
VTLAADTNGRGYRHTSTGNFVIGVVSDAIYRQDADVYARFSERSPENACYDRRRSFVLRGTSPASAFWSLDVPRACSPGGSLNAAQTSWPWTALDDPSTNVISL